MKIRKGDMVKMRAGKDRGKTGKVIRVLPEKGKVVVEGLQTVKKHLRPRKQGEKGQMAHMPMPVPAAKVMLVCPKCGAASRVGYRVSGERKVRVCKKCNSEI